MENQLPKFPSRLFNWFCNPELVEELQGDLEEAFYENVALVGEQKARKIYTKEVFKMLRPSVVRSQNLIPSNIMRLPKNYLKTSIRAIKLNPFYVFANILGLALAISICTVGYFNYRFNATFNEFYSEAESVYKVNGFRIGESTLGTSSIALASSLRSSDIEAFRYTAKSIPIREHNHLFSSRIAFADKSFFRRIPLTSLNGTSIQSPGTNEIAISEKLALKLFNESYPVGRLVKMVFPGQKEASFVVKDVYEIPPTNVSFIHEAITSFENYTSNYSVDEQDWTNTVDGTFVFANKSQLNQVQLELDQLKETRNSHNSHLLIDEYQIANLLEWPAFESQLLHGRFNQHLHSSSVYGISATAISILLLACFNFINTSIALSGKRLKEIAVRKVMGGNRKSTIVQFMIENTFMITIAVIVSVGISSFLIPTYNAMFERELIQMDRIPVSTLIQFAVVLVLIVTLLSAAYPSFYVSRFSSLKIFRDKVTLSSKNRLMLVLLTFQFAMCFYNIFGVFLNVDNAYYQNELDRGYLIDQVVNIPLDRPEQYQVLADHLNQDPKIEAVAGSFHLIGFSLESQYVDQEGNDVPVTVLRVGTNYSELMDLRLTKGSFHAELGDNSDKVVINSLMERHFGKDMLNETVTLGENKYTVIGVVDDFNVRNIMMDNKIPPTIIRYVPEENYHYAVARVSGKQNLVNSKVEELWYETFPQELYKGFPQEDVMQNSKGTNGIFVKINLSMAIISVLISIIGLYTLVSLNVQKRSKEFGVRKVLGATRKTIIHLLGKDLYWILGIAAIVGLSSSSFILTTVFDIIYAYHVSPEVGHFIKASIVVLLIVVLTIGYKVYQTSKINPAQQLRTE